MKTLLVPVDFTTTTENAVDFAIEWSRAYQYERIILLKTFYDSIFENVIVSAEYSNINEEVINREREEARAQLHRLCVDVAEKVGNDVKVQTYISEYPLTRAIVEVVTDEQPELIILGSDNYSYSSESFVAANVITIAKISPVKVMIVPADYQYKPVHYALLPYNIDTLKDLDKMETLKRSKPGSDLKLLVLNVNTNTRQDSKQMVKLMEAQEKIRELLQQFPNEMFAVTNANIIKGIIEFTREHDVQLIIALPGKHSFLYKLTHQSISEAIYRNAKQPVLILK